MTALLLFLILAALYFLPVIIAINRGHPNALAIALVNLLLGWTFLGWVIALIWSVTAFQQTVVVNQTVGPDGQPQAVVVRHSGGGAGAAVAVVLVAVVGGFFLLSGAAYWYYTTKMKPAEGTTEARLSPDPEPPATITPEQSAILSAGFSCDRVLYVSRDTVTCAVADSTKTYTVNATTGSVREVKE
jgi:hypothetical protein